RREQKQRHNQLKHGEQRDHPHRGGVNHTEVGAVGQSLTLVEHPRRRLRLSLEWLRVAVLRSLRLIDLLAINGGVVVALLLPGLRILLGLTLLLSELLLLCGVLLLCRLLLLCLLLLCGVLLLCRLLL